MSDASNPGSGLALIGYRGTGKSTVGRLIVRRLGREFVDADRVFESRARSSIAAFFAEHGEPSFRDLEERILGELSCSHPGAVLSTGGGVILRQANREALRRHGFVAWLSAQPDTLAQRLRTNYGGRPALTPAGVTGEIVAVLEARLPHYRETSDATVETDGLAPDQVADRVIDAWRESGRLLP